MLSDLKPTPHLHIYPCHGKNQLFLSKAVWGPGLLEVFRAKYFGANSLLAVFLPCKGNRFLAPGSWVPPGKRLTAAL